MPVSEKLTQNRLISSVAKQLNRHPTDIQAVWDAAIQCVRDTLIDGRSVVLLNLGTLDPVVRKARTSYDLQSQAYAKRPRRRSVRFIPSKNLRAAL